jgi:hypothetical protein
MHVGSVCMYVCNIRNINTKLRNLCKKKSYQQTVQAPKFSLCKFHFFSSFLRTTYDHVFSLKNRTDKFHDIMCVLDLFNGIWNFKYDFRTFWIFGSWIPPQDHSRIYPVMWCLCMLASTVFRHEDKSWTKTITTCLGVVARVLLHIKELAWTSL